MAIGDFGSHDTSERRVAAAIERENRKRRYDLGLTLGDNCYETGLKSADDPLWGPCFGDSYDPLGIKFHPTLGNHDYMSGSRGVKAQIEHTKLDPLWDMPNTYYTFTEGPVRFFAMDTALNGVDVKQTPGEESDYWNNDYWNKELSWLKKGLDKPSDAPWTIVYSHKPIYSRGFHGSTPYLVNSLLPVIRGRVDVYLAGHDHDLEHLTFTTKPPLELYVCGGGGASVLLRPALHSLFTPRGVRSNIFFQHGFLDILADPHSLQISLINVNGERLSFKTLTK